MNAIALSSILFLTVFCTGCATTSISSREKFLRAHSSEREKYLKFWEVSPEALLRASEEERRSQLGIIRMLRKDFGKYPDLLQTLDALEQRFRDISKHEQEVLGELQREFDPKRDTLFFYVRLDGKHEEDAWIIVRDNRVRKKYVLGTAEWNLPNTK